MSITAIRTVGRNGIPRTSTCKQISVHDEYPVVEKTYHCSTGHDFAILFESPIDMPVFWECPSCEIIAFEA